MAAAQIAMDHFNERNSSVVPQLADLGNCSVYFTPQVIADTRFNHEVATEAVMDSVQRQFTADKQIPCGVIGPAALRAAFHLQSITGALNIPQMMFYNLRPRILEGDTVIGVTVSIQQHVDAMLSYLSGREFLFVVYDGIPGEGDIASMIQRMAQDYNLQVAVTEAIKVSQIGGTDADYIETYRQNARDMKMSGIKTITLGLHKAGPIVHFATLLEEEGMLTSDYIYILSGKSMPIDRIPDMFANVEPGTPLDKLLSGALVFDRMDNFRWREDDPFLAAWRQQNTTFVDRMNSLMPLTPEQAGFFEAPANYFQTADPVTHASYVYDSVMALGFGGCMEQNNTQVSPLPPPPSSEGSLGGVRKLQLPPGGGPPPRKLDPHVAGILASAFDGASGRLSWTQGSSNRDAEGLHYGLYNIRRWQEVDEATGKRPFEAALISLFRKSTGWQDIEGETLLFRDGSTAFPSITREVLEDNTLSSWVRCLGLVLLGSAWTLGFVGIVLLWYLRKDAAVQRAQPFFMQLLCGGSVLTSTAIFTLSWDEGAGWSDRQLDMACMATPWFFFVGHMVMFSAMFTKLWRVDKVMQFRRRNKVTVRNVLGPLVALLVATLAILSLGLCRIRGNGNALSSVSFRMKPTESAKTIGFGHSSVH
jgi:hypothetical protein